MPLRVWEYDRDDEALQAATVIAMDQLEEPDFTVGLVSNRGDHVTVQVASGALTDPAPILYLESTGVFEIVRVELWPDRRLLLVLRAWPNRP